MDNIRNFFANFLSNKKQVITFLLIGITVLSIPVGLQLVQQQQTIRSQAADYPYAGRICTDETCCQQQILNEVSGIPLRPPQCHNENPDDDPNNTVCTWQGMRTYDQLKAFMKIQSWNGDMNNKCAVLDAFSAYKKFPGACVARVQEEYKKADAAASLDPWVKDKTMSKVVAQAVGFRVGALDDRGTSIISGASITVIDPAGNSTKVNNLSMYTPTRTGTFKVVTDGGSPGQLCRETATVNVTNQCASSCSQCVIKNRYGGFMVTYREGGWQDTSCSAYDQIVNNWCTSADPTSCQAVKAGVCSNECRAGATNPPDDPAGPTTSDVTYTGTGTVSCDSNSRATFTWTPANITGKTVQNYTLRINKSPADWGPDSTTPAGTAVDGDRILQAGNNTSITVGLTAGEYLDWTIQPGFSDGTVTRNSTDMGVPFTCPGGQGQPNDNTCKADTDCSPPVSGACNVSRCVNSRCELGNKTNGTTCTQGTVSGTCQSGVCQSTTPPANPGQGNPGSFVTDSVKIVEDNSRNSVPEDDPIWDDTNVVIEKPYSEVKAKKTPFTFRELVCVTSPCDTVPNGDRWVHVLFIGRDSEGNVVKKSESQKIYLALLPKIDSITCEISASGNTAVTISGSHFGTSPGSIRMAEQNAQTSSTIWDNLTVRTTFPGQLGTNNETITLTTPEGQTVTGKCTLGQSQIDFTATLSCRSISKALTTASIEVKDASNSASIFKQEKVNFDGNGHPQGVLPNLVEGKDYVISIQPPLALRKTIPFKAQKGTTVLQAFDLPLGDIDPERPDCKINSLDIRRLFAEWASNVEAANRRGDLNQDGRVNSIDYACMRSNFDKSCDSP